MRTRRTREQWAAVLEELEGSGEAAESFCRRRGIRRSTLSWWKWRLGSAPRRSSPAAALRLLPVTVSARNANAVASAQDVVIDIGDVRVHVEVGTDVAYVGTLVEALRRRC